MPRKRIPATGTYKVRAPKTGSAPADHMANFGRAIQNALDDINWPAGDHQGASLHLSATIRVRNPGTIIEYCATFV